MTFIHVQIQSTPQNTLNHYDVTHQATQLCFASLHETQHRTWVPARDGVQLFTSNFPLVAYLLGPTYEEYQGAFPRLQKPSQDFYVDRPNKQTGKFTTGIPVK